MSTQKSDISNKLSYRLAGPDDLPILRRLRVECGWGLEKLEKYWGSDDHPLCLFSLEGDEEMDIIGMGGWILEDPDDSEAASRAGSAVGLCASPFLFRASLRTDS
jgi:hypothetical protein